VVIRATVLDETGVPVPNATVVIDITGPEAHSGLTTGPSDASGIAELTWQTQACAWRIVNYRLNTNT
jgi:uncharacterized GH25 family protein